MSPHINRSGLDDDVMPSAECLLPHAADQLEEGLMDEESEEEEVPEDLQHLGYDEQQRRIKLRSAYMLTVGTVMCSQLSTTT
jgi:hypothetical protein